VRRAAELLATSAGLISRRLGRGGGTSLPGNLLLRVRPRALSDLAGDFDQTSIAVSATNGKTTTARLLTSSLEACGHTVLANTAGANLLSGIVTTLLEARRRGAKPTHGVYEVDEAALTAVSDQLRPEVIVLMNLFRDQLDRYGELETILDHWRSMIDGLDPSVTLVLNADDPGIASLGDHHDRVIWFGVDDPASLRADLSHAADSTRCHRCDSALAYDGATIAHFGHWCCTSCDNHRPTPDVSVHSVQAHAMDAQTVGIHLADNPIEVEIGLPGLHNAYNAAAAVAALRAVGADLDLAVSGLAATHAAFGRGERVEIDGRDLWMLLAKNPTGANENLRTVLSASEQQLHLLILLNDRTADGRDVSWIWDVDYEVLADRIGHLTISGERAHDLALRFRYGGFDDSMIDVIPDVAAALDHAVATAPPGDAVFALPTYTALLDLRGELTARGITSAFWEDQ